MIFWARLRGVSKRILDRIGMVRVPRDIAERVHLNRSFELADMFRVISMAGCGTLMLWAVYFRNGQGRIPLELLFFAAAVNYLVLFHKCHRWVQPRTEPRDAAKFIREMFGLVLCLGLIWAAAVILMMQAATAEQAGLIYAGIVVGMSIALLLSPLSVALAFWVPVTAGAALAIALAIFMSAHPINPYAAVCLLFYAGMSGCGAVCLNGRLTKIVISAIRLEDNADSAKLRLRGFEEDACNWLWETDANLEMRHVSARLAEAAGSPWAGLEGRFPDVLLARMPASDPQTLPALAKLSRYVRERAAFRELIIPVIADGQTRIWQLTGKPVLGNSGEFAGYRGVGSDVTAARRSREQMTFLARHDSLTKLPNRVVFSEMLHVACAGSDEAGVALLVLDLDAFQSVNDRMGHPTGDALLVAVAERIRCCLSEGDIAARLGGDEFGILLMTKDVAEATEVARRLIDHIGRPYRFDGKWLEMTVSIGVTMAPRDGDTPSALLKNADLALARAKAGGRAAWRLYDVKLDERAREQHSLLTDLRQALARGEFYLKFQPVLDLASHRIVAAEALLRWYHPERGQLSPDEFIPMAECSGLIAPIGAWVLRQACMVAAGWPEDIRVAVNLSPLQFRDTELLAIVDQALTAAKLAPGRLELEITENTLLENNKETSEALRELRERGISLAMDDFGTGYSSLGYLRRFRFDKIKIDRSFIQDLGQEEGDTPILTAIIGLAASLNLVVTAEGIETEEQAAFLKENGCAQGQGFLFYPPLLADQFSDLLANIGQGAAVALSAAQ